MKLSGFLMAFNLLFAGNTIAEVSWDELDVIDGPNPTLRYGFYTEPSGRVNMGRYYFVDDGDNLRVRLAEYGKAPIELPVRSFDRERGVLETGWEGRPGRTCRLNRQNDALFLGNCLEGFNVMPLAIRVANEFDMQWLGTDFEVSEIDLAILARAQQLFESQDKRNTNGDRICDDDLAANRYSVFCALYHSSIEIDGVYRHRRPAMRAARKALLNAYPGDYVHTLRDINNDPLIRDEAIAAALKQAHRQLQERLESGPKE
jgi:hypothetical protein